MTPITCKTCPWFWPDDVNQVSGMGECMHDAKHGYWHAMVKHRCRDHESTEDADATRKPQACIVGDRIGWFMNSEYQLMTIDETDAAIAILQSLSAEAKRAKKRQERARRKAKAA